mmetsp:Transcript_46788/g.124212  ORF Transcript_46788/g.124212 Transcript_46788/m.124212 type:complete len:392 (+) Transcript_46788:446-1621(+)
MEEGADPTRVLHDGFHGKLCERGHRLPSHAPLRIVAEIREGTCLFGGCRAHGTQHLGGRPPHVFLVVLETRGNAFQDTGYSGPVRCPGRSQSQHGSLPNLARHILQQLKKMCSIWSGPRRLRQRLNCDPPHVARNRTQAVNQNTCSTWAHATQSPPSCPTGPVTAFAEHRGSEGSGQKTHVCQTLCGSVAYRSLIVPEKTSHLVREGGGGTPTRCAEAQRSTRPNFGVDIPQHCRHSVEVRLCVGSHVPQCRQRGDANRRHLILEQGCNIVLAGSGLESLGNPSSSRRRRVLQKLRQAIAFMATQRCEEPRHVIRCFDPRYGLLTQCVRQKKPTECQETHCHLGVRCACLITLFARTRHRTSFKLFQHQREHFRQQCPSAFTQSRRGRQHD